MNLANNINTYADLTAYNADLNKEYPNVSYIEEDDIVLFEKINYAQEYFAIESLEDNNTIMFKLFSERPSSSSAKTISVSTDDGKTWANYTSTTGGRTIATLNNGEKVLIKGNNSAYADGYGYNYFYTTRQFDVSGNIMSLIYGDNFKEKYSFPSGGYNLEYLFYQNTSLVNAENLVLPATTLATSCYFSMFSGCTSLKTAPALPATTLASYCYSFMFRDCTSLTSAPQLPATTLADSCYTYMFNGCTNLKYIKAMFTTKPAKTYTESWVSGVSASGTFVKNSAATWNVTGNNGVPTGWTVQKASS